MRSGWVVIALMLVGVVGLGAYAWHQGNQPQETTYKLSALSAVAAKKVEIIIKGATAYTLEKRGDSWLLTSPIQARADQTQVQRILDLLSASRKEKLAATDLARFDLEQPALSVKIDGQTFSFGTNNPLTQDQYLATGDGVYMVSSYYASLIPATAERMLAHSLFTQNETPLGFTFKALRVQQKDGKWILEPAPAAETERPSQDDLNRWADDWRYASSLLTQPWDAKPTAETVQVKLTDGKTVVLHIVQKEPELILGRPDEKLQFRFSGEMSRRLLQPTAKEAARAGAS